MKFSRLSMVLLVGVLLCSLLQVGISPVFAEKIGGQSPVLVVAPHYLGCPPSGCCYKNLPGVPIYLTPDGYPVMRTHQGEWGYMVNPEAVQIPGPQITVVGVQGIPIQSPVCFSNCCPQGVCSGAGVCPSCFVLPPVGNCGQISYYPVGYGGFVVLP